MPLALEPTLSGVDLPVVDISKFPGDFDSQEVSNLRSYPELAKLREACKEWGFFTVVNHGIPVDLVQMAETICRNLLSMPTEVKDRASTGNPLDAYYRRQNYQSFHFRDSTNPCSFEQLCAKLYPEKNPNFCETMATYASCVSDLAQKITKLILASVGLDAQVFSSHQFDKCARILRINGYTPGKMAIGDEAVRSHTDTGCLTILYQDDVGGLQIRSRDGKWFNVKPLSDSFVVNVGDSLKAWTNGRYRSADHRVVCQGYRDRMSIAFFTAFPAEKEIWAPEELVDDNNPRRYKPFVYSDFMREFMSEDKSKAMVLERFVGI